jgi:hypothetical protein
MPPEASMQQKHISHEQREKERSEGLLCRLGSTQLLDLFALYCTQFPTEIEFLKNALSQYCRLPPPPPGVRFQLLDVRSAVD